MGAENAETVEVTVGGRSYRIARFRGLKAQIILRLSAQIGRKYPKLATQVAEFEQAYIEENKVRLSRTEAELRYGEDAAKITDEAWETTEGEIALKRMPSPLERFAAIWPEIFEAAEEPAMNLIAVLSLSNEELADADDKDEIDETIKARRKLLFHNGEAEEIIELAVAGIGVARGQFAPLVERVIEPVMNLFGLTMGGLMPTTSSTSPEEEEPSSSSATSKDSETSPSSSTASEPPTAGDGERSSERPGSHSEPSPGD